MKRVEMEARHYHTGNMYTVSLRCFANYEDVEPEATDVVNIPGTTRYTLPKAFRAGLDIPRGFRALVYRTSVTYV
jgi:hypothetical protein